MKKIIPAILFLIFIAYGCKTTPPILKSVAYKGMYDEKPITILLMPPINRSTCVEAKEYFHSTLNVPVANAGFYVIPPFISMEILKKESAFDAELFINAPLNKFGEVFGADVALFTIINKWDKTSVAAKVSVEIEYIFKSIRTNEILFTRTADVIYDTSVHTNTGGAFGALADMAASALATAFTKYVDVARTCNAYTLKDLPAGKYSPLYGTDGVQKAGPKNFSVTLNSQYR